MQFDWRLLFGRNVESDALPVRQRELPVADAHPGLAGLEDGQPKRKGGDISGGENAFDVGLKMFVDDDVASAVELDAGIGLNKSNTSNIFRDSGFL